jgi:hypothetical protein
MGLVNRKFDKDKSENIKEDFDSLNSKEPSDVSPYEVKLLKEMWDTIKSDIAKVGVITFVR